MDANVLVEVWEDFSKIRKIAQVDVIGIDGWTWLLAWAQIGVKEIQCHAITDVASKQLAELKALAPFRSTIKEMKNLEFKEDNNMQIISLHVSAYASFDSTLLFNVIQLVRNISTAWVCFISVTGTPKQIADIQATVGSGFSWQLLRHTSMGGLTSARANIGIASSEARHMNITHTYPKRPLNRFLDPVARNTHWRRPKPDATDCWFPHSAEAKPYPWPWFSGPEWVETNSVLLGGTVQRKFTLKERCQLLDMRSDWVDLVPCVLAWAQGTTPPLRLCVETVVRVRKTLWALDSTHKTGQDEGRRFEKQSLIEFKMDWGRTRPPLENSEIGASQIEQVLYFGWFWDPQDALDITVATRGDDAVVDLRLWAVGGEGDELEAAREVIRTFLWNAWVRRLCKEARTWMNNLPSSEAYNDNKSAMVDCLWRCIHSSWWNWDSGSRLHFWRWSPLWRAEARDGSLGFHYKYPRPQLKFPQVPIAEQWIVEKDQEKLEKLLRRKYIIPGYCKTTVPRFPVPKGTDDIRVVWDLSKNGLNDTM